MIIKLKTFKYLIYVILILAIFTLFFLNILKYSNYRGQIVTIILEFKEKYFKILNTGNNILNEIKNWTNPEEVIFRLAKIRINIPITYLRREIFLLSYYTPPELQNPTQRIYDSDGDSNEYTDKDNFIQLKFDLRDNDNFKEIEIDENEENSREETTEVESETRKDETDQSRESRSSPDEPEIAVYHTHTSETYIDDPRIDHNYYVERGEIGNIGRVGQHFANQLSEKYNINVYHTTRIHDRVFRNSYAESERTVKNIVDEFSDLEIIFDFHRDALENDARETYTTTINDQEVARIMIVVTNGEMYSGLDIDKPDWDWEENYQFARKLADKMEEMYPGLLLGEIDVRNTIFNQDHHHRALLLEIGDRNNTTTEALRSAELLADVVASLTYEMDNNSN